MTTHYERLSARDASFLAIEDPCTHMHVAATLLFDPGPLATADGGLDVERIRSYIESRLRHIPRYRQRLEYIPYEQHPVWIDDDRFNLFHHVRHTSLPRPGSSMRPSRCGRSGSSRKIEGGRFALVAKAHHCMVDGVSGIALFSYCDGLYWGVCADWDVVPDLHDFVDALAASFADLVAAQ